MKKLLIFLATFMFVACSSTPMKEQSKAAEPLKSEPSTTASGNITPVQAEKPKSINTTTPTPPVETRSENLTAELQKLHSQSIYFDFDKSTIKPEYRTVIEQQAAFLKTHGNSTVTVEGNADERGSNEYNLALGDRRAHATRKNLEILGIPPSQIKVMSYGEEKPRLTCHEEKCWQENRRCDFTHKPN